MDEKSKISPQELKKLIKKIVVRFSLFPVFIGLLTLLPAGTFNYWQVYLYIAILTIPMIFVISYFLKRDPLFLERRIKGKETEQAQKIFQLIFSLIFLSGFIVSGLDRRFGWSNIPFYFVLLADLVILFGYLIIFYVFRQNSFASRVVEVEDNQTVISSGLYSFVRHPMYVGMLVMFIPAPVALGSWWGVLPMAALPIPLVLRILNEESVLKRELPGYPEYCQKTKYRLIPYVW